MTTPAGRYRRVRSRLWVEEPFIGLTEGEKLVVLYLLTGPFTNAIGLYRLPIGVMAEDLRMTVPTARRRFATLCRAFGWRYDSTTRILWLPAWVHENPPQNPNIVTAWRSAFGEIPESDLKAHAGAFIQEFLAQRGESFAKSFVERSNHLPNAPDPDPEGGTVRRPEREARRYRNAASTRETVGRLRALSEQRETRPPAEATTRKAADAG